MSKKQSLTERFPQLKQVPADKIPNHIFIIPDGNGRWAKARNQFVTFGHTKGFQVVESLLEDLSELKEVGIVTVYGFATDNWKRSKEEVSGLMFIFSHLVKKAVNKLKKRNGRFIHLGRKDKLPTNVIQTLQTAEEETKKNTGQIVCLAIDFGGDDQDMRMIESAKHIPDSTPVTKELLWKFRDGQGIIPPADLLIRTSGEIRTSDIGWLNGAPTELYFIEKLFPDIVTGDIIDGIIDFSKRVRRFGGRNEK